MLRPYPEGSRFKIQTDHQVLRWILHLKESIGRFVILRFRQLEFDFEVVHRPGGYHQAAVEMSRFSIESPKAKNQAKDDISTLNIQKPTRTICQSRVR